MSAPSPGDARGRRVEALRLRATGIWQAALEAADPSTAVHGALERRPFAAPGEGWDLLAVGKAAGAMARAALESVTSRAPSGGLVVPEVGQVPKVVAALEQLASPELDDGRLRVMGGGHPLPTPGSEAAAVAAEELLASSVRPLLVVLSGGGSALLAAPAAGLTLDDEIATTALLQGAGADIGELNCVRRHLSRTKGGGLGRRAGASGVDRRVRVLVLSDVLGDALEDIASGPFYGDPTRFADAEATCRRLGVWSELPSAVARRLAEGAAGEVAENPTPAELAWIEHEVVGSLERSVEAAVASARAAGLRVTRFPEWITGEARDAGAALVAQVSGDSERPSAWIGGGETVVTVRGRGVGGRAQELALGFVAAAEHRLPGPWVLLSVGTDGRDGPGEAAGALVDSETLGRARQRGLEVDVALADNDASPFLRATGDLVVTGRTGTNVGDVAVLLLG